MSSQILDLGTVGEQVLDPSQKLSHILQKRELVKIILCCITVTVGDHITAFLVGWGFLRQEGQKIKQINFLQQSPEIK